MPGDTVADFTLYSTEGTSHSLSGILSDKKPVLLITASYSCYLFREQLAALRQINQNYGDSIEIYIIYTLEAHPWIDTNIYSGTVWTTSENFRDSILIRQHRTYGDRLAAARQMKDDLNIDVPVLLDGTCNEYWHNYGPAPLNAYLIDTNGTVFAKQSFFNGYGQGQYVNMATYIEAILGFSTIDADTIQWNGTFLTEPGNALWVSGIKGEVLTTHFTLINPSPYGAIIEITQENISIPSRWQTSFCADLCYLPGQTEFIIFLPPNDTLETSFYFYTTKNSDFDTALVKLELSNVNNSYNKTSIAIHAAATQPTGFETIVANTEKFSIYPNPAKDYLIINCTACNEISEMAMISLYDQAGREIFHSPYNPYKPLYLSTEHLCGGLYFYRVTNSAESASGKVLIVK